MQRARLPTGTGDRVGVEIVGTQRTQACVLALAGSIAADLSACIPIAGRGYCRVGEYWVYGASGGGREAEAVDLNSYDRKKQRRPLRLPSASGIVSLFGVFVCRLGSGRGDIAVDSDDAVFATGGGLLCAVFSALLRLAVGQ